MHTSRDKRFGRTCPFFPTVCEASCRAFPFQNDFHGAPARPAQIHFVGDVGHGHWCVGMRVVFCVVFDRANLNFEPAWRGPRFTGRCRNLFAAAIAEALHHLFRPSCDSFQGFTSGLSTAPLLAISAQDQPSAPHTCSKKLISPFGNSGWPVSLRILCTLSAI